MKLIFRNTNVKGNGIVGIGSWLIRRIDKAILPSGFVADHVGFYLESSNSILEAHRKDGVREVYLEQWRKELKGGFKYEIVDFEADILNANIYQRYLDLKGTKYSYIDLIWQWIYIKTGVWIGRKNDAYNAFVCSEFVDYCLSGQKWWKSSIKDLINKYVNN